MNIKNLRGGKFLPAVILADGTVTVHATKDAAIKAAKKAQGAFFWFRLNQTMINDAITPRLSVTDAIAVAEHIAALAPPAEGETRSAADTLGLAMANAPGHLVDTISLLTRPDFMNARVSVADMILRQVDDLAAGEPDAPKDAPGA